jgi:hypothetical protein
MLPEVTILVGGQAAASYSSVLEEIGARHVGELSDLRAALLELRPEGVGVLR